MADLRTATAAHPRADSAEFDVDLDPQRGPAEIPNGGYLLAVPARTATQLRARLTQDHRPRAEAPITPGRCLRGLPAPGAIRTRAVAGELGNGHLDVAVTAWAARDGWSPRARRSCRSGCPAEPRRGRLPTACHRGPR